MIAVLEAYPCGLALVHAIVVCGEHTCCHITIISEAANTTTGQQDKHGQAHLATGILQTSMPTECVANKCDCPAQCDLSAHRHGDSNDSSPDKACRGVAHVGNTQLVPLHQCKGARGTTLQQTVAALQHTDTGSELMQPR
jgi:hypothetical protein